MTDRPQVHWMTDDAIQQELDDLHHRSEELRRERVRRLISLDGDIGRREPRLGSQLFYGPSPGRIVDGEWRT